MGSPTRKYEEKAAISGFMRIAGVDEAGRGPLAGPVVSAAVILPSDFSVAGVTDSKCLTPVKREALYEEIYHSALGIGIGIVDPVEIDRINILQASLVSMAIAVENLSPSPDYILIDGNFLIGSDKFLNGSICLKQECLVGGDSKCISIAAASIIAKVTRDRIMVGYHLDYPEFNFPGHKGYATRCHLLAIANHGCCPIHRTSFKKDGGDAFKQLTLFDSVPNKRLSSQSVAQNTGKSVKKTQKAAKKAK